MKTKMINLKPTAFLFAFFAAATLSYAAEKRDDKSPLGCRDLGYKFELKTLDLLPAEAGERQSLYFIFNALSTPINLYQMLKDNSTRSMYLNHVIRPRQWAVLSTSEKELKYICTVDDAKLSYGKVVDCAESVKVCEYARVKYGMNNKGNYWLVNSNTSGGAVNEVLHYGIIPR
jgi:hypothetical protein